MCCRKRHLLVKIVTTADPHQRPVFYGGRKGLWFQREYSCGTFFFQGENSIAAVQLAFKTGF